MSGPSKDKCYIGNWDSNPVHLLQDTLLFLPGLSVGCKEFTGQCSENSVHSQLRPTAEKKKKVKESVCHHSHSATSSVPTVHVPGL